MVPGFCYRGSPADGLGYFRVLLQRQLLGIPSELSLTRLPDPLLDTVRNDILNLTTQFPVYAVICRICRENAACDILETDRPGIDWKCSENVFPQLRNTVHGSNLYFVDQITREMEIGQ